MLEDTDQAHEKKIKPGGKVDYSLIAKIPALFVNEINGPGNQLARTGTIFSTGTLGKDVVLEYAWDLEIDPIPNSELIQMASELGIGSHQFSRTHWSIINVDLFKTLMRHNSPSRRKPSVFQINIPEVIEEDLVSVMMPFSPDFNVVYETIQQATQDANMRCNRADDIWIDNTIIQDVVSLIDRSRIVVCDCTRKNPNVFYETGIAHTLGRDVVLITQSQEDIPFDVQHHRYIRYLNNTEGLNNLRIDLAKRINTLVNGTKRS